ncbi:MAG: bifunctional 4-hydroxy-3-methylbut-2-enyl diphosphate reductase/30S ribosomal protein S1 [Anaerofustis sp.]
MKIMKAKSAGFCFGVDNAVNMTVAVSEENPDKKIATLGELIHNSEVVRQLGERGIEPIDQLKEMSANGILIIRSHGVGKDVYEYLKQNGIEYVDATCPYVKSIQNKVEKYYKKGYTIIIVGDRNHPEVIGVNGWCNNEALIVNSIQEASELQSEKPICVVAQTTIIKSLFEGICNEIQSHHSDAVVFNTICSATELRQKEACELSEQADAMIVIGGYNSSNTKKLVEICKEKCSRVYHIETAADIHTEQFGENETVGITAGASTPTHIILEVMNKMDISMENFEKSLDELKQLRIGDIVTGEIISVNPNEVVLNVGAKSDGIIKKSDYLLDLYNDLTNIAAIGDKVDAMVVDMNDGMGNIVLSKIRVDEIAAFEEAEKKFNEKETINGKITKIVKGGVIVDIGFTKAFMPANQYALRYTEDLNALLGKEVSGRIIEFDKDKNRIIFSRRVILQEELNAKKAEEARVKNEAIAPLELDAIVSGPVKNITDFGVFIDLNGVDGFIHVSDLSWSRVPNPKNFCNVGDVLEAKIIEIDKEKFKVKLSVKNMTQEPWAAFLEQYHIGDIVPVVIKSTTKFGAFAEIIPSVEGLIHISNLSHEKVDKVESVVNVGDTVKAKIIEIDKDKKKIGLSIKDTTEAPKKRIEKDKIFYREDSKATMEDAFKKFLK